MSLYVLVSGIMQKLLGWFSQNCGHWRTHYSSNLLSVSCYVRVRL